MGYESISRMINVDSINDLYIQLGYIQKLGVYVYLPFEALIKRWSAGFPIGKGRFYNECKFTSEKIQDSIQENERDRGNLHIYGLEYENKIHEKLTLEIHCNQIAIRIGYKDYADDSVVGYYIQVERGELRLYSTSKYTPSITLWGDAKVSTSEWVKVINKVINEVTINDDEPAYCKKLKTKFNMINETPIILTDGVGTIVFLDDVKDYFEFVSRVPCHTIKAENMERVGVEELRFSSKLHYIILGICNTSYINDMDLYLPLEIWSLKIGYDYRFAQPFKELSRVALHIEYNTVIESVNYFNISWLGEEAIKIAKYARRIYRVNKHNLEAIRSGKVLELSFENLVYVGAESINLLMPVIYNFNSCEVEFSTKSIMRLFDDDCMYCKLIFKVGNHRTLINLIELFKKVKPGCRVLVIVKDNINIENLKRAVGSLKIINESEYDSWGLSSLSGKEYWSSVKKAWK